MTTIEDETTLIQDEQLVHLHLRVARRADELARRQAGRRSREDDARLWFQAEREIIGAGGFEDPAENFP